MQNQHMPTAWITPALLQDSPPPGSNMLGAPQTAEQGAVIAPDGSPATPPPGTTSAWFMLLLILVTFGGMLLMMSISGRKEKKQRAQMLASLGRKDKVQTAGGIIGTIIEIKDNEVLIETDRASHTRLWLAKGSISSVIRQAKHSTDDSAQSDADEQTTTSNA